MQRGDIRYTTSMKLRSSLLTILQTSWTWSSIHVKQRLIFINVMKLLRPPEKMTH